VASKCSVRRHLLCRAEIPHVQCGQRRSPQARRGQRPASTTRGYAESIMLAIVTVVIIVFMNDQRRVLR
jgi:hypothetical protein